MKKVCPVVLRSGNEGYEVLAFKHPIAGYQIVKGTIEENERAEIAGIRELMEESGIHGEIANYLGAWDSGYQNQVWEFYVMSVTSHLPNEWEFYTEDDGGHNFSFFWQPLNEKLNDQWHPLFQGAIGFIKRAITKLST
ncbi:NUDIX hydrolase [Gayadomonas joobiniege]|uniref:NUDIX hydrolase n=1 Tax=Gayadomonas joobiniege TaxID=1234606 RepID=UPI0003613C48|nr:NUDIX domain-containing protein [Gayadomonas joobiniege]